MQIKLDDDYYIVIDSNTYNLSKKTKNKDGEYAIIPFAYCSTLPQAIHRYMRDKQVKEDKVVSLKRYVEEYKKEVRKISDLVSLEDIDE